MTDNQITTVACLVAWYALGMAAVTLEGVDRGIKVGPLAYLRATVTRRFGDSPAVMFVALIGFILTVTVWPYPTAQWLWEKAKR